MDLAEYRTLFVLSFTTPAFDPDVAPSFGTLLATINVALSMLSEVNVQCNYESFQLQSAKIPDLKGFISLCHFCVLDGKEERACFLEHRLTSLIRRDPSTEVSKSRKYFFLHTEP